MYNKRISPDAFVSRLKDGMSIMFGGFMGCGTPERIVGLLLVVSVFVVIYYQRCKVSEI